MDAITGRDMMTKIHLTLSVSLHTHLRLARKRMHERRLVFDRRDRRLLRALAIVKRALKRRRRGRQAHEARGETARRGGGHRRRRRIRWRGAERCLRGRTDAHAPVDRVPIHARLEQPQRVAHHALNNVVLGVQRGRVSAWMRGGGGVSGG
jgi:hypothetical protein